MFNNLKNEPFINDGVTFMVPWFKKCNIFFSFIKLFYCDTSKYELKYFHTFTKL